jgi:hypothetical protein
MFLFTRPPRSRLLPLAAAVLALAVSFACSDEPSDQITGPQLQSTGLQPDIRAAILAQERHNPRLRATPGVVGTAVGLNPAGKAVVRVFTASAGVAGIPASVDNVPVSVEVTGMFTARSDPTTRQRPAPVGFSVGHYAITAGTIGARVKDGGGAVYILSNNHVLANSNNALVGDHELQPGPYDGGTDPGDLVGTLFAFQEIDFFGGDNLMDAAIALSSTADVGNSTPTDDGYGLPNAALFGDANNDGVFDNKAALLNLKVQKYGRTTKLTHGTVTGINGSVAVCYDFFIICWLSANYVDQLIITPGTFSGGGDSGSLIVTDDGNKNPVGLLFAGSSTQTIANRIDLVLNRFGVKVDGSAGPPPPPPPPPSSLHVGDLDATSASQGARKWKTSVTIRVHDGSHAAVASATVTGSWNSGATGSGSCTTGSNGACAVTKNNIPGQTGSVTFSVTGVTHATLTYDQTANHDPDGDSSGTAITVAR